MAHGDDVPPPPEVTPPAPVTHQGLAAELVALSAARFGARPEAVRIEEVAGSWCQRHRQLVVRIGRTPMQRARIYVDEGGQVVHVAEGWPPDGVPVAARLLASVSQVLASEGLLRRDVEASLLAQRVVDVMCCPPPRVMNATTQALYLGRDYPIETWISPTGRKGSDILRACSRDPELRWSERDFRLDFFTLHDGVQDWIVSGDATSLTGAKQDAMLPPGLWPPTA